jgi:hypothetical protein
LVLGMVGDQKMYHSLQNEMMKMLDLGRALFVYMLDNLYIWISMV